MKKATAIFLAAVMLSLMAPPAFAASVTAVPNVSGVLVNGEVQPFDAYNIGGNNYFKLRDIAYVLNGTPKQFEVLWSASKNAINLVSGKAYTPAGGEMAAGGSKSGAEPSDAKLYLNGSEIKAAAYNIGGSNYFMLRDIGKALNFNIGWNGSVISIDSSKGYDYSSDAPPVPEAKSIDISTSLKKGMTDAEFNQAYAIAAEISAPYMGLSREEQLEAIFMEIRYLTDTKLSYSQTAEHYSDIYGFFVLGCASCAGATRAVGICLTILGIPYEHVNENQWSHQWCRVEVGGTYWICDAFGYYVGPEPAPYKHPWM